MIEQKNLSSSGIRTKSFETSIQSRRVLNDVIDHSSFNAWLDAVNYKATAFESGSTKDALLFEIQQKRAVWDAGAGQFRCPDDTPAAGQFTNRVGEGCSTGFVRRLAARLGSRLSSIGEGLGERRTQRDRSPELGAAGATQRTGQALQDWAQEGVDTPLLQARRERALARQQRIDRALGGTRVERRQRADERRERMLERVSRLRELGRNVDWGWNDERDDAIRRSQGIAGGYSTTPVSYTGRRPGRPLTPPSAIPGRTPGIPTPGSSILPARLSDREKYLQAMTPAQRLDWLLRNGANPGTGEVIYRPRNEEWVGFAKREFPGIIPDDRRLVKEMSADELDSAFDALMGIASDPTETMQRRLLAAKMAQKISAHNYYAKQKWNEFNARWANLLAAAESDNERRDLEAMRIAEQMSLINDRGVPGTRTRDSGPTRLPPGNSSEEEWLSFIEDSTRLDRPAEERELPEPEVARPRDEQPIPTPQPSEPAPRDQRPTPPAARPPAAPAREQERIPAGTAGRGVRTRSRGVAASAAGEFHAGRATIEELLERSIQAAEWSDYDSDMGEWRRGRIADQPVAPSFPRVPTPHGPTAARRFREELGVNADKYIKDYTAEELDDLFEQMWNILTDTNEDPTRRKIAWRLLKTIENDNERRSRQRGAEQGTRSIFPAGTFGWGSTSRRYIVPRRLYAYEQFIDNPPDPIPSGWRPVEDKNYEPIWRYVAPGADGSYVSPDAPPPLSSIDDISGPISEPVTATGTITREAVEELDAALDDAGFSNEAKARAKNELLYHAVRAARDEEAMNGEISDGLAEAVGVARAKVEADPSTDVRRATQNFLDNASYLGAADDAVYADTDAVEFDVFQRNEPIRHAALSRTYDIRVASGMSPLEALASVMDEEREFREVNRFLLRRSLLRTNVPDQVAQDTADRIYRATYHASSEAAYRFSREIISGRNPRGIRSVDLPEVARLANESITSLEPARAVFPDNPNTRRGPADHKGLYDAYASVLTEAARARQWGIDEDLTGQRDFVLEALDRLSNDLLDPETSYLDVDQINNFRAFTSEIEAAVSADEPDLLKKVISDTLEDLFDNAKSMLDARGGLRGVDNVGSLAFYRPGSTDQSNYFTSTLEGIIRDFGSVLGSDRVSELRSTAEELDKTVTKRTVAVMRELSTRAESGTELAAFFTPHVAALNDQGVSIDDIGINPAEARQIRRRAQSIIDASHRLRYILDRNGVTNSRSRKLNDYLNNIAAQQTDPWFNARGLNFDRSLRDDPSTMSVASTFVPPINNGDVDIQSAEQLDVQPFSDPVEERVRNVVRSAFASRAGRVSRRYEAMYPNGVPWGGDVSSTDHPYHDTVERAVAGDRDARKSLLRIAYEMPEFSEEVVKRDSSGRALVDNDGNLIKETIRFRVNPTTVNISGSGDSVYGSIEAQKEGESTWNYIGSFSRSIYWNEGRLYNSSMAINQSDFGRSIRGGGWSETFNGHAFRVMQMAGFDRVGVSTATDGPYVWPRSGFRSEDTGVMRGLSRRMRDEIRTFNNGGGGLIRTQDQADMWQYTAAQIEEGLRPENLVTATYDNSYDRRRYPGHIEAILTIDDSSTLSGRDASFRSQEIKDWFINTGFPGGTLDMEEVVGSRSENERRYSAPTISGTPLPPQGSVSPVDDMPEWVAYLSDNPRPSPSGENSLLRVTYSSGRPAVNGATPEMPLDGVSVNRRGAHGTTDDAFVNPILIDPSAPYSDQERATALISVIELDDENNRLDAESEYDRITVQRNSNFRFLQGLPADQREELIDYVNDGITNILNNGRAGFWRSPDDIVRSLAMSSPMHRQGSAFWDVHTARRLGITLDSDDVKEMQRVRISSEDSAFLPDPVLGPVVIVRNQNELPRSGRNRFIITDSPNLSSSSSLIFPERYIGESGFDWEAAKNQMASGSTLELGGLTTGPIVPEDVAEIRLTQEQLDDINERMIRLNGAPANFGDIRITVVDRPSEPESDAAEATQNALADLADATASDRGDITEEAQDVVEQTVDETDIEAELPESIIPESSNAEINDMFQRGTPDAGAATTMEVGPETLGAPEKRTFDYSNEQILNIEVPRTWWNNFSFEGVYDDADINSNDPVLREVGEIIALEPTRITQNVRRYAMPRRLIERLRDEADQTYYLWTEQAREESGGQATTLRNKARSARVFRDKLDKLLRENPRREPESRTQTANVGPNVPATSGPGVGVEEAFEAESDAPKIRERVGEAANASPRAQRAAKRTDTPTQRPTYPRTPPGKPFSGKAEETFGQARSWDEFSRLLGDQDIIVVDYETTGIPSDDFRQPQGNMTGLPTQLGAVRMRNGEVVERFNEFMNPGLPFDEWEQWSRENLRDSGGNPITPEFVDRQMSLAEAHQMFADWAGTDSMLVMQNADFDRAVLDRSMRDSGIDWQPGGIIDTKEIAEMAMPKWTPESPFGPVKHDRDGNPVQNEDGSYIPSSSLGDITRYLGIELGDLAHTADADAFATGQLLYGMARRAQEEDWSTDVLDPVKRDEREKQKASNFAEALKRFESDKKKWNSSQESPAEESVTPEAAPQAPAIEPAPEVPEATEEAPTPAVAEPVEPPAAPKTPTPRARRGTQIAASRPSVSSRPKEQDIIDSLSIEPQVGQYRVSRADDGKWVIDENASDESVRDFLTERQEQLRNLNADTFRRLDALDEELSVLIEDASSGIEDAGGGGEDFDLGSSVAEELSRVRRLIGDEEDVLRQIQTASGRIADGSYGISRGRRSQGIISTEQNESGLPINPARLEALPFTEHNADELPPNVASSMVPRAEEAEAPAASARRRNRSSQSEAPSASVEPEAQPEVTEVAEPEIFNERPENSVGANGRRSWRDPVTGRRISRADFRNYRDAYDSSKVYDSPTDDVLAELMTETGIDASTVRGSRDLAQFAERRSFLADASRSIFDNPEMSDEFALGRLYSYYQDFSDPDTAEDAQKYADSIMERVQMMTLEMIEQQIREADAERVAEEVAGIRGQAEERNNEIQRLQQQVANLRDTEFWLERDIAAFDQYREKRRQTRGRGAADTQGEFISKRRQNRERQAQRLEQEADRLRSGEAGSADDQNA